MTVCCINYHWGLGVGINDLKNKKTSYNQSILPLMLPGTQGRKGMQSPSPPEGSTMGFPLPNILPAEKCQDRSNEASIAQSNETPPPLEEGDPHNPDIRASEPPQVLGDQEELHPSEKAYGKPAAEVRHPVVRQHFQDHLCPYVSRLCPRTTSSTERFVEMKR